MNMTCSYGEVNRTMIESIKDDIKDIKDRITELANHYSNRIRPSVAALISILAVIASVSLTIAFTN